MKRRKVERVENPDGIYKRIVIPWDDVTPEDCREYDARIAEMMDLEHELAAMGRDAELSLNHANEDIRKHAATVKAGVYEIHRLLKLGEIKRAIAVALVVGRMHERMHVRPFEPMVVQANKSRKGLGKGRTRKAVKTAARQKAITAAVQARMDANRRESLYSARHYVATQLGISFDSVKRATTAIKPRNKMKK